MKDKIFGVLQRVGRSFMLPIAILPVAGLLLGVGGSLTNETMLDAYGLTRFLGPGTFPYVIFTVMNDAGNIVFTNLPIIFAMGVAIGMAKKEKEVAALAAAIAFFIMHASIGAMITIHGGTDTLLEGAAASVVGITSLQMGVFGGIIVGLGVAALHNKFYKIQLPQVLSFFGGTRFVPIISGLVYTVVGIAMYYIWPPIQSVIYSVGNLVLQSGYFGTWIYGIMERALIPFGLHHVFYLPFWQTALGGTMEIQGQMIEGAQNIFFAQLSDPTVERFAVSATRFMTGKFPFMIFGLPGAALAMYRAAKPEKRKLVSGLLLSAALTSMLTGITEPLEFTFLFVAPLMYVIHCILAGLSYMLMHILNVGVGLTFSGGLIDLFLFGVLQGNAKTGWLWIIVVGLVYFVVYYFLFYFMITRMNYKTPGREDTEEVKLYRRSDYEAKKKQAVDNVGQPVDEASAVSALICRGLGGKANISDIDCCATRLRCTVHDSAKVVEAVLRESGAAGVIQKGNGVQVIYGPKVTVIKSNLEDYLDTVIEEYEDDEAEAADMEKEAGLQESGASRKAAKQRERLSAPAQTPLRSVVISSPITGRVWELEDVPDEGFAGKMMGDGAAVEPFEAAVVAPADGAVQFAFDTGHAVGLLLDDGTSMLIHVGIDTVKLHGKGFEVLVKEGDSVRKGDTLIRIDLDYVKAHAPSLVSPVLCTELEENQRIRMLASGNVKAGDDLYVIETYPDGK